MNKDDLKNLLTFIREAEQLKTVLRSAHASNGRQESTAEHTWRLCLLAMVLEPEFGGTDIAKLLKICVIHDLGEAIHGDVPAVEQSRFPDKSQQERRDLMHLLRSLPQSQATHFLALWDEYENASSPEARLVKGLDKLETIIQHNQGRNPEDFDYAFNLSYGQAQMAAHPVFSALRQVLDEETRQRAQGA